MSPSRLVAVLLVVIIGLSVALLRQPSIVVSQSVPLEKRIAALETRVYVLEQESDATTVPLADIQIQTIDAIGNLENEAVLIVNESDAAHNLKGWRLEREGGPAYTFGNIQLFSGGSVWLSTGDGSDTTVALYWNESSPVWTDGSTARLINEKGEVISNYEIPALATPSPAVTITPAASMVTSTPLPVATVANPAEPDYKIVRIEGKVTESNAVFEKNAWIMEVKNNGNQALLIDATIDFEDADGFIVSQDYKFGLYIGANEIKEFTGVVLIPLESSLTVANIAVNTTATVTQ